MMFVLTLGFAGLFAVLTIIIKYLSLLVDLVFKKAELPDREHRENPKVNPAQAGKGGSHRIDAAI